MSRRVGLGLKRCVDVVVATAAAIVLSPVLAWAALGVAVSVGRPIFFRQQRPGLHGTTFEIVKFRTMRAPRAGEVWFLSDQDRITRLGRFLRSTSIDELPELWNVLRGDMSLVGPRPLLVEYLPHYTDRERRRHEMRPGITGWAAVNGRHTLPFEDRLELDAWYVDNWSLALDLRIVLRTAAQVLGRSDVRATQDHVEIAFPARFKAGLAGDAAPVSVPAAVQAEGAAGPAPAEASSRHQTRSE
jgi:lipopolysaccharide/colanic/teichoic acid biosynthesis glycosyltransferase